MFAHLKHNLSTTLFLKSCIPFALFSYAQYAQPFKFRYELSSPMVEFRLNCCFQREIRSCFWFYKCMCIQMMSDCIAKGCPSRSRRSFFLTVHITCIWLNKYLCAFLLACSSGSPNILPEVVPAIHLMHRIPLWYPYSACQPLRSTNELGRHSQLVVISARFPVSYPQETLSRWLEILNNSPRPHTITMKGGTCPNSIQASDLYLSQFLHRHLILLLVILDLFRALPLLQLLLRS
jgi:hypothetical protein